jgi:hypothetical protein
MADIALTQLLRFGRKRQMGVGLAGSELVHGVGVGCKDEVFAGIEPDPGGHQRDQLPAAGLSHSLPFQVSDGANVAVGKQLVTAAMNAGDDGDRRAFIDADYVMERQVRGEVDPPASNLLRHRGYRDVDPTDIGESLGPQ